MGKVTIYDVIRDNYAKVKNNDSIMWETTKMVSDALGPMMDSDPEKYWKLIKDMYAVMCGDHFNENFAEWEVSEMYHKDKQGAMHKGQHWSIDQTDSVFEKMRSKFSNTYNKYDWYVTMNMMYHDNYCMYKEWWPDAAEDVLTLKIAESSANYLADIDAEDGKIWRYLNG